MDWHYSVNSVASGPVPAEVLQHKISVGEVRPGDLVWREGMPGWVPVSTVPELARLMARPMDSPYAPPLSSPIPAWQGEIPGAGKATACLVLGIVSCASVLLCGLFSMILSLPCGIIAIVFARQLRRGALENPLMQAHSGKALAGLITGWIGAGVSLLIGLFFLVMMIIAFMSGEFR